MKPGQPPPAPRHVDRRQFMQGVAMSASVLAFSGCEDGRQSVTPARPPPAPPVSPAPPAPLADGLSAAEVLALAETRADHYMGICHNCAQSSFLVLHEVFGLGDASLAKALTPLPGIAERGETCGAVIGALLALGFVYGRERLDDWAGWRACLVPARKFCEEFEREVGSTKCGDIVEELFGQRYNLADPADLRKFQEAGPTAKCGKVVRQAVRLAAELILERG